MNKDLLQNKINVTIVFSLLFILGVISFFAQIQLYLSIFIAISLITLICMSKINPKIAVIAFLTFIGGFYISDLRVKDFDSLFYLAPRNNVVLQGQVISILETNKPDRTRFYFKPNCAKVSTSEMKFSNSKTIVTLFAPREIYSKIRIGDTLELKGNLRTPQRAQNPAEFDYAKYLQHENTFSTFFVAQNDFKIIQAPDNLWLVYLQKIDNQRNKIIKKHSMTLKSPYIELLGGVVFGDDAINPTDNLKESFKISGLLHLLAASGLNVGIIFSIWFFIGRLCRLNYRWNIIIGGLLIILYTCMTGFSPSILRATLMIEFILLGKLIDRQADNLALISFVCFLMLLYNPSWVCSISFQLSFLVTTGLIVCMPKISDWAKGHFNKFGQLIINSFSVPLIAQIWVLPLQMFYFNTFALYSVFANILVLPFITVVSFVGFVASILAMPPFIPNIVIKICDCILSPFLIITVKISDFVSALPNANLITIQPDILHVIVYYILLVLIIKFLKSENKKPLIWLCVFVLIFLLSFIKIPDNKLHLTFFSVKNADSCLVKTPKNHYFIIDTGKKAFNNTYSQGDGIIAKYLLSKGVRKIDFVLLTHLDNDHIGGTVGLLKKIHAGKVFVNSNIATSQTSKELFSYMKSHKIPYAIVENNTIIYEEDNLVLKGYLNKSIDNENENSIINLLQYKDFNALFMGDAGIEGFKIVPQKIKINVLKLGHHGAKGTINKSIIDKIKPETTIISTGKNQYGHPHFSVIDLLINSESTYFRTDEKNAIEIISDGISQKESCYSTQKYKFIPCEN